MPLFKGVGLAHLFNAVFIIYYYNVIIAWCVYFFGASFATTLPWTGCDIDGAERSQKKLCAFKTLQIQPRPSRCFDVMEFRDCVKEEGVYLNHTCITSGSPAWDEVLANNIIGLRFVARC